MLHTGVPSRNPDRWITSPSAGVGSPDRCNNRLQRLQRLAAAGLAHVRVATLDALTYEATRWLHGGCVAPLLLVRTDACAGSGDILDSFACVLEELSKSAC